MQNNSFFCLVSARFMLLRMQCASRRSMNHPRLQIFYTHASSDVQCPPWCLLVGAQSLMFLLAAEDFAKRFEEVPAGKPDSYQKYLAIVDKFIRDRSPYEVNIESRIKREILRTTDRGIFDALSTTVRPSRH